MTTDQEAADGDRPAKGERIAKALARAGVGSRREVERMIAAGRVKLDGQLLDTPAVVIDTLDRVLVDDAPVAPAGPPALWRYHKPRGQITTHRDPQGRPTVFDALPKSLPRVVAVGRLDLNTEGLLLLTNDGELARWMELPSTGWPRTYRVRAHGTVDAARLAALADGITIDGVHYGAIDAGVERQSGANAWLTLTLREGKNREVRRVLEHLGLAVNRLIRVSYGPFQLGGLARGTLARVPGGLIDRHLGAVLAARPARSGLEQPPPDRSKWAKAKRRPAAKRPRRPQRGDRRSAPRQRSSRPPRRSG